MLFAQPTLQDHFAFDHSLRCSPETKTQSGDFIQLGLLRDRCGLCLGCEFVDEDSLVAGDVAVGGLRPDCPGFRFIGMM